MKIDNTIAAIVTGGASGLGRASAKALADAGVKVAVFDISEEAGEAFAAEIGGVFCNVNIMDEESVEAGFAKARAAHGQERLVVHCAVVAGGGKTVSFDKKTGAYKRTPTEQIAKSAEGIFTASYRVASIAALGMANAEPLNEDGERGAIIFTSSAASQDGQIGQVAYGGGKGAVNAMVLPMARDLMDLGIRVNAILPGTFATPPMLRVKEHAPEVFEGLGKAVPFPKRLGNPDEFASLVLELARNTYLNGQLIRLDGAIRMPPK
ncbi:NAD(P)-dependent dehydrogenase (short-subunit alcohol dehydrogenase family) [Novosphingobium chloroacetimidivorans]|uniref:NAD(P)-dependent dehydrogenase (Short-subunit alcohol dehydrogenase family) n=1 Tax=Novosphingobium chloroacetimidivorans TaxID=1428314 RepID=A0A7W7NWT6_9SPHN|nr:SDR family oxidoreductase [Novosphingobium chloroacetimidivorans]MBB4858427.1 NAD(P)-dependent dehydrogenase (short-subunit alcohol dehydrogenase family) [Novosphingobium chloroacetimidivorans]